MIRTQIFLTEKQHKVLTKRAGKTGGTLSGEIRNMIDKELDPELFEDKKQFNTGNWLLSMAKEAEKIAEKGPADLAENLDQYLYGDK